MRSLSPAAITASNLKGEVTLDIGPGYVKRISANSVKPGAKVGVGVGTISVASGVDVGAGVAVGGTDCVRAADVAKAASPVNATIVGR